LRVWVSTLIIIVDNKPVDFSKLKLEIYDLLGVIFPGLLVICEGWVVIRGWPRFITSVSHTSGVGLTLLLILAFGVGQVVQEGGDVAVKFIKGERYFKRGRDNFWKTEEASVVKDSIEAEFGRRIESVDAAYDYCLARLAGRFAKRNVFIATSDLCRSLVVLAILATVPAARMAFWDVTPSWRSIAKLAILLILLLATAALAWTRMARFRKLADVTVFRAYLGIPRKRHVTK
jgi:hypothetical protein